MAEVKHEWLGNRFWVARPNKLLLHLLLILFVVLFTCWEMFDVYQKGSRWFPVMKTSAIILFVVYLNIYVLAPQFLLKKRWYWVYLLTVLYVALFVYFVETGLNHVVYLRYTLKIRELFGKVEINPLLQVFTSIFSLVLLMVSSSAILLFHQWSNHEVRVHQLENAAMQMELEQLKTQVSPQLLVRSLDKVNALTLQGNRSEASALLLKLGNVLRYQLYDSARTHVLLSADIHFLTEMLLLEQQYRSDFSFTVESDGPVQNYLIPPMLFLPFVAFVISTDRKSIRLFFQVENGAMLFECFYPCVSESSIEKNADNPSFDEFAGLRRRLFLLYENSFLFETKIESDMLLIRLHLSQQASHYHPIKS